jgi:hypothetical protein
VRHFVAEIHNIGDAPFGRPSATVSFYDGERLTETAACSSIDPFVAPGKKTPCFFVTFKGEAYGRYAVAWQFSPPQSIPALVVSDAHLLDVEGLRPFAVEGKITNKGATKARSVAAIVSLYDLEGKIVGAEQAATEPAEVDPGQTATFSVKVPNFAARAVTFNVIPIAAAMEPA